MAAGHMSDNTPDNFKIKNAGGGGGGGGGNCLVGYLLTRSSASSCMVSSKSGEAGYT